jgi:quercetin dioxygenase-like cupin family protein
MQGGSEGKIEEGEIEDNREDEMEGNKATRQISHVRNPHEGKMLAIGSMQVTIKATGAETEGRFALVEITVPPYSAGIWPHLHQNTAEAIYLTQGMLAVTLGEETMVVRQGSFVLVPPQQPHRFWNPAATAATFLAYFAPAGVEEFFEVLSTMEPLEETQLAGALAEVWALAMRFDHYPIVSSISTSSISSEAPS